jgi:hypothetical protein
MMAQRRSARSALLVVVVALVVLLLAGGAAEKAAAAAASRDGTEQQQEHGGGSSSSSVKLRGDRAVQASSAAAAAAAAAAAGQVDGTLAAAPGMRFRGRRRWRRRRRSGGGTSGGAHGQQPGQQQQQEGQPQQQQQRRPQHRRPQRRAQQPSLPGFTDATATTNQRPSAAAVAAAAATDASSSGSSAQPVTRFFIDEGYFEAGETEILRAYISASRGRMVLAGESTAAFLSVKGYYAPAGWDVYFTIRDACLLAFPHMQRGQRASCLPGARAVTLKKPFVAAWQAAYGERAFGHIPRSYALPEQYWMWRRHLAALDAAAPGSNSGSSDGGGLKWVLKANVHRGKGVRVLPQAEAVVAAAGLEGAAAAQQVSKDAKEQPQQPQQQEPILVQSYLSPQVRFQGIAFVNAPSSYTHEGTLTTNPNRLTPLKKTKDGHRRPQQLPARLAARHERVAAARLPLPRRLCHLWQAPRRRRPCVTSERC